MIKTNSLLAKLAKKFPKRFAKQYHDYVGLMVGRLPEYVKTIYLALDFEPCLFDEAMTIKPDLIITHHPFVYGSRANIRKTDPKKYAFIEQVANAGLVVYSLHTNFDRGQDGMNDALAQALGLENIRTLQKEPMARGGKLPHPMSIQQFSEYAKTKLHASYGLLLPYGKQVVETAAIIGGGGAPEYKIAQEEGYDVYISGDMRHHIRRAIINDGYNYLDLPHEIESIFVQQMEKILLSFDKDLIIKKAPLQQEALVI
jgi:dinuclear metal center YbgI/SA1388 family protein